MIDKGDIYTYLQTKSAVTSIVGTRIFPDRLKQGVALPALVLSTVTVGHEHHLTGGAGVATAVVQIDCWADTESDVLDLADAVRESVDAYSGAMGSMTVTECLLANEREGYEHPADGSDSGSFRVSMDFRIWYQESIV